MKLPSIVKQVGEAEGNNRIYIEDYVYSYLKELKAHEEGAGCRAVLYGQIYEKEQQKFYFIYGAACVAEEFIKDRDEEQIREDFFPEWDKIGYVNVHDEKSEQTGKRSGYCIFYDANEEMQNYLLSCYNRENVEDVSIEEKEELKNIWISGQQKDRVLGSKFIQKCLCVLIILFLGVAITTIDEYHEMYGFVEAAKRAVLVNNIQDEGFGDK